jgi:cytochrome c5
MIRYLQLLLVLIVAAGCSRDDVEPSAAPAQELLAGQAAYEKVCAGCHEEGIDGAPLTGDSDAWADRSSLWVGVLEEHAINGYLKMPPKGGDPGMIDEEVAAAAAFMLTQTHPDRPPE